MFRSDSVCFQHGHQLIERRKENDMRKQRKCKSIISWLLFFFIALVSGSLLQNPALAFASQLQNVISPGNMNVWENGAKVTKTYSGEGSNYHISLRANTFGLSKRYYSVYLYDLTARNLASYDGIAFNFQNKSGAALKIDLTFTTNSGTSASISDGSYAILEKADHSLEESASPSYGTISIPANFDGSVYVPLSKLYTSDGKNVSIAKIQSWGVTAVMSENEQIEYQMGNIRFLGGSLAAMRDQYYQISLSGVDSISIPHFGSTIESYQAQIKDMDNNAVTQNPTFYLKNNVPGVTLSADGKLQISSDCTASSVTIGVKLGNSMTFSEKTIALKKSAAAKSGVGVPQPSIVPKITKPAYVTLNRWLGTIRIFAGVVLVVLIGIVFSWFFSANRHYIHIRKKLLEMIPDHESGEKK